MMTRTDGLGPTRFCSLLAAAVGALALAGCSKGLPGTYSGDLVESCSVVKMGTARGDVATVTGSSGGTSTTGYRITLKQGPGKGRLEMSLKGCTIVLTESSAGRDASVEQGAPCPSVTLGPYTGPALPGGVISATRDGGLNVQITLSPTGPGASGACAYTMDARRSS